MHRFVLFAVLVVGSLAIAAPASATTIVVNGSFETGDLTGWTDGGNTGWNSVSAGAAAPGQGSFGISNGAVGTFSLLSQTLPTVGGTLYNIDFWLQNDGAGFFNVVFDGVTVFSEAPSGHAYTQHFLVNALATTNSTVLQLQSRDDPGFIAFDAINVDGASSSVPEPVTGVLLATGVAALLRRRVLARRGR